MSVAIIVLAVAAFIAWGIIASRRTSARKKEAIADLKTQQERIQPFDIHALVSAEVEDLGLRSVSGAAGIPAAVLLKTWKDGAETVDGCPSRDLLRFVITPGLDPSEATDPDVTLVCDDMAPAAAEPPVEKEPDDVEAADDTPDQTDGQQAG